ncbi:MAG: hypothetical protein L6R42_002022 [Xanthoria sp. 1 TBL-2021]|nr:MAG: hypothetical protein L6R42_002022 [Xanthoria sp. 1 TBL-2021]
MAPLALVVTVSSSIALRLIAYVFLRWIPGHHAPPLVFLFACLYAIFFAVHRSQRTRAAAVAPTSPSSSNGQLIDTLAKETDNVIQKGLQKAVGSNEITPVQDAKQWPGWALLWGFPHPTSFWWTLSTAGINAVLCLCVLDLVYRARIMYPSHEVSFARVGHVSDTSANLLIREPNPNQLPVFVSYRSLPDSGKSLVDVPWKAAGKTYWLSNETDYTFTITMDGLQPTSRYQFAVSNNQSGHFNTAPRQGQVASGTDKLTFLTSSCIKPRFPYSPLSHPLSMPGFRHLASWLPSLKASFMLFLGDFIYVDVPRRLGSDPETYRREYRQVYNSPDWPSVSKDLPWIHVLDDHEIANDWDGNTTAPYPAAADPWRLYHTSVNPPSVGPGASYFQFVHGPASFFLMDTRRYRSPSQPLFANSSEKSMLGSEQLAHLLSFLSRREPEGVKWKFVISSIPFTRNWRFGSTDTWANYLHERQIILEAMWSVSPGTGIVVLSGDRHEFAATAFPPPEGSKWPVSATVHEFSTSPLSMFYLPFRTYEERDGEGEPCVKYVPDGNSKFGAVEVMGGKGEQGVMRFRLFVDGEEVWDHVLTTGPVVVGGGRGRDAVWG